MINRHINKIFIEIAVNKGLKDIRQDSRRGTRNLADLGKIFAKGELQNRIFLSLQGILARDDSPYFRLIEDLVGGLEDESLRTFSLNLGYNGLLEARRKNSQEEKTFMEKIDLAQEGEARLEELREAGVASFLLYIDGKIDLARRLVEGHRDSAFFLVGDLDEELIQALDSFPKSNSFFLFRYRPARDFIQAYRQLGSKKILRGIYLEYNGDNYSKILDNSYRDSLAQDCNFLFLAQDQGQEDLSPSVYNYVVGERWQPEQPILMCELDRDLENINREIFRQ